MSEVRQITIDDTWCHRCGGDAAVQHVERDWRNVPLRADLVCLACGHRFSVGVL